MPKRMEFFSPKQSRKRSLKKAEIAKRYSGNDWDQIRTRVLIRDSFQCNYCGRVCGSPKEAHVDHITPVVLSGSNDESNLQVLCSRCHARKTNAERRAQASH